MRFSEGDLIRSTGDRQTIGNVGVVIVGYDDTVRAKWYDPETGGITKSAWTVYNRDVERYEPTFEVGDTVSVMSDANDEDQSRVAGQVGVISEKRPTRRNLRIKFPSMTGTPNNPGWWIVPSVLMLAKAKVDYKAGDRVTYVGGFEGHTMSDVKDQVGTVVRVFTEDGRRAEVKFDDGSTKTKVHVENLMPFVDKVAKVRAYIIKTAQAKGWSRAEINLHLRNMDLEEWEETFTKTVTITSSVPLTSNDVERAITQQYSTVEKVSVTEV